MTLDIRNVDFTHRLISINGCLSIWKYALVTEHDGRGCLQPILCVVGSDCYRKANEKIYADKYHGAYDHDPNDFDPVSMPKDRSGRSRDEKR